jgi:hypothetical protein
MTRVRWIGNDSEKKSLWPNLRYYTEIFLEGLRKAIKIFIQESRSPDQDMNPRLPEYEAVMLITRPQRSVEQVKKSCSIFKPTFQKATLFLLLILKTIGINFITVSRHTACSMMEVSDGTVRYATFTRLSSFPLLVTLLLLFRIVLPGL